MKDKRKKPDQYTTRQLPEVPVPGEQLPAQDYEEIVVPLVEEGLRVNKQWVKAGEVVLTKHVETHTETLPVELGYDEVEIERVPVNRLLAYGEKTDPWQDGDVWIIPVVEEELVVSKRMVLREEIHIKKHRQVRQEEVSDTVRREDVTIETTDTLESS